MLAPATLLHLALLALPGLVKAVKPCYYPNGELSPNDTPCNGTAQQSTCCGATYACLSNNICAVTTETVQDAGSTTYVRGSCTDSTWGSPSCPQFCIDPKYDNTAGGNGIGKCPKTSADEYYCIDTAEYNCSTHQNVLSFAGSPTYVFNPVLTSTVWSSTITPTSSSTSSTTGTTTPDVSRASYSAASRHNATSAARIVTDARSTAVPSESAAAGGHSGINTTALGVGLGIGIPLGLVAIALLIYLPLRYRQKKRVEQMVPPYDPAYGPDWKEGPQRRQGPYEPWDKITPELGSKTPKVEMYTEREPQELPGARF